MLGTHQLVFQSHIDDLVNLSGIDQMVAAHDGLILHDGRCYIVEMVQLNQATAFYVEQTCLAQRLTDVRVV